jgi:hypothetical protein
MTRHAWFGAIALLAGSVVAAQSGPKDDVKSAAKKLSEKNNYSWKMTVDSPDGGGGAGGRFRIGPTEGKAEKDGFTVLTMVRGENTIEAVLKGGKGAIKGPEGWTGLAEVADAAGAGGGQRNPGALIARTLQNFKAPVGQVEDLVSKVKDLKKTDDVYSGDLTEDGAKELLSFGRRGGNAPAPTNARGSVKFWVIDGMIAKFEYNVQGTITFNNNDVNVNRTTTVEIKDVNSTKVDPPEEAKKKMSGVSA